ncbi:MAG: hypothetical protein AAF824_24330 [Bacteroidota bacterium]
MDFQIIYFLDTIFRKKKRLKEETPIESISRDQQKVLADYHFIITEYLQWEQEEFDKRLKGWEREAAKVQSSPVGVRHYVLAA